MKTTFRRRALLLSVYSATSISLHGLGSVGGVGGVAGYTILPHSGYRIPTAFCHSGRGGASAGNHTPGNGWMRRFFSSDAAVGAEDVRPTSYEIKASAFSIIGRRDYMEDEYVVSADKHLAGVFDGHAGAGVSKYINKNLEKYFSDAMQAKISASEILSLADQKKKGKDVTSTIIAAERTPADTSKVKALDIAHIFEHVTQQLDQDIANQRHLFRQGSTFCSVYVHRNDHVSPVDFAATNTASADAASLQASFPYQIVSCNIGDSRAILSRNGQAIDLTKDHKPELPEEKSRIEKVGGFIKWDGDVDKKGKPIAGRGVYRVNGNLALSRAVGDMYMRPFVVATPDITLFDGDWKNDEFIIVATDGFWDVFSSEYAVHFVHEVSVCMYSSFRD
jgi:serine/threonine protein phosphatase PrpC